MSELHLNPLDANEMQVNESEMRALISITSSRLCSNFEIHERQDYSRHLEFQTKTVRRLVAGVSAVIAKDFQLQCFQNSSTQQATESVNCIRFLINCIS